jgi:AcrR family transcriptional regulator
MAARGRYAKGLAKREEILDAALDLFARNGYDRTSVREIARLTGLTQAGLLHHFTSKEELFVEVLRRRDRRSQEEFSDDFDQGHHTVRGLISVVRHNAEQAGLVRLFVTMSAESTSEDSPAREFFRARYDGLKSEVAADIRRSQDEGMVARDLDPEAVASILIAAADGLQIQWLLDPAGPDMAARLEGLWNALLRVK